MRNKAVMGVTLACVAGSALAEVPWDVPNGETDNFFYENGGSDQGLFGNPVVTNDGTFIFNPSNFRAIVEGVGVDQITDQLFFDIIAKPGFNVTGVRISEVGDYTITGDAEVSIGGGLIVTNLEVFGVETDILVSDPGSPISDPTPGATWTATAEVDLAGRVPAWNHIRIQLDNTLVARAFDEISAAFVEKKSVGAGIRIEIIPTPATIALLGVGVLVASRRRR